MGGQVPPAFRQTWRLVSLTPNATLNGILWKEWPYYLAGAGLIMSPRVLLDRLDQWLDLLTQHDTRALESFSTLAPALAAIAPEATEAVGHTLRKLDFREARRQAVTLRQTAAVWAAKEAAKDQDAALGSPGERPPVEPPGEGT